jgi:hypothetical protein
LHDLLAGHMAPKGSRKPTATERIARHQQQALQLQTKHSLDWIIKNLRARQDLVPAIVQHMKQLGISDIELTSATLYTFNKDQAVAAQAASPESRAAASVGGSLSGDKSSSAASIAGPEDDNAEDPTVVLPDIPRKYRQWSALPPGYLVELLSALEPVSMGKQALKVYAPKGKKTLKRAALEQLWEFVTGIPPTANITPKQRNMEKLKQDVQKVNVQRGRVARDIVLPVNWGTDGHYFVEIDSENPGLAKLKTKHNEKAQMFKVSPSDFELEGPSQLQGLYVDLNWSEERAVVCHPCNSHRVIVALAMAKHRTAGDGKRTTDGDDAEIIDDEGESGSAKKRPRQLDMKKAGIEVEGVETPTSRATPAASPASSEREVDEEALAPARPPAAEAS